MATSSAIHFPQIIFPPKTTCYPMKRLLLPLPAKVKCFQGKLDGSSCLKQVAVTVLTSKKEEVKDILTLFLKQQGLSSTVAATVVNKSDLFSEHLVSRLHILHKTGYLTLTGKELTSTEIRDALSPYLEELSRQHGDNLINMIEHFPRSPGEVKSAPLTPSQVKRLKMYGRAMARVGETVLVEDLPPHVIYLIELGLDLEKIRVMIRKFPSFAYCSLERKVKPLVEFLLELGVSESDIPRVLYKSPHLCTLSLSKKMIPTMKYLEELGVDKQKWSKLIVRFPIILAVSRQKINSVVSFLIEIGVSKESIGYALTRYPNIVCVSVEDKLRPAAKYFKSIGVDVAVIGQNTPQVLAVSVEGNLRPMTEFFLEKGYSMEEIAMMIQRCGVFYACSLSRTVKPKWEFFLSMGYPRSELVKFPHFFCYSLEARIKPRYALMKGCGARWGLNTLLCKSDIRFQKALKAKMEKTKNSVNLSKGLEEKNPIERANQNGNFISDSLSPSVLSSENHCFPNHKQKHSEDPPPEVKSTLPL
ncbi:Transcription termination factor MTERF5, chloroplastic-like protein [Drosera capensis]